MHFNPHAKLIISTYLPLYINRLALHLDLQLFMFNLFYINFPLFIYHYRCFTQPMHSSNDA